ncbi:hypothetical protein COOONC_22595 [Cooperia oncophora]
MIVYVCFACFIKKAEISSVSARNILRSLIVISLSTVFGWLSTMIASYAGRYLSSAALHNFLQQPGTSADDFCKNMGYC